MVEQNIIICHNQLLYLWKNSSLYASDCRSFLVTLDSPTQGYIYFMILDS